MINTDLIEVQNGIWKAEITEMNIIFLKNVNSCHQFPLKRLVS